MGLASHCLIVWLALFCLSLYILECDSGKSYVQECFLNICNSNLFYKNTSSINSSFFFFHSACEDKLPPPAGGFSGYKPANCKWKYCPGLAASCSKKWSQIKGIIGANCLKGLTNWWKLQKISTTCKKTCKICGMFIKAHVRFNLIESNKPLGLTIKLILILIIMTMQIIQLQY